MADRQGFHDEILPASMTLKVGRGRAGDAQADPPTGIDTVVLPVTIEIPMTPELQARLGRR